MVQAETARLREHNATPDAGLGSAFSAPVGGVTLGRLVFLSAVPAMEIRADATLRDLYRASFHGPVPRVRVRAGVVTVRYARFAWFDWRARIGDQVIDTSVHWRDDRGELALNHRRCPGRSSCVAVGHGSAPTSPSWSFAVVRPDRRREPRRAGPRPARRALCQST